ncbi:adenylate/guanylate cyclase domain-containing response regulator [Leptolyngbya iicbica LK]|uniref:Adenylate/guanylate cyclase domain-containing response regulator n=2 Tax=Cyanophyceae TaxID=3028117 RepID=A0A4Q7EB33_9CYAN|nr:adenylate/guanylate cyclase domain-containing response regulator [Leptolyngbya sp. LK]
MTTSTSILLVDDDPQNLYLMAEVLEAEGYQVQQATSGTAALEAIAATPPHLVLLDIMMPEMDGFEVCEQIRQNPQTATVPIIFLTALSDDDAYLKSVEVMGDDYLTKPIQLDLVLKKIQRTLRLKQLRDEAYQAQLSAQTEKMVQIQLQHQRQMTAAWKISEALAEKFYSFVPQQFLTRVAPRGLESLQVGNANESDMTILFCDIREFTAIAETQTARATFAWLNVFFESINQAVMQHQGFVDKYLGDAVMAVFDRDQHHACDAVQATAQICQALEKFNGDRHQFGLTEPIRIGIGLHSGRGLIGTVGANQRMDTTVVGDVVNTASRLEHLTKTYQCATIISEAVIEQLPTDHNFQFRWLDLVTPRGKTQSLNIYALMSGERDRAASVTTQQAPT